MSRPDSREDVGRPLLARQVNLATLLLEHDVKDFVVEKLKDGILQNSHHKHAPLKGGDPQYLYQFL